MKSQTVDRITGITAILISLLTLIMFIYQTNIIHQQSRLSVMPRLVFSTNYTQVDTLITFSTLIKNKGIGPAIINEAKMVYNEKEYKAEVENFFDTVFPELYRYGDFRKFSNLGEGNTLAANESKILFAYEFSESQMEEISTYLQIEDEDDLPFNIEVIYSSMYEERWKIDIHKGGHPIALD